MSLKQIADSGTKIWSDSVDPDVLDQLIPQGVTGATSNPVIIADLVKTGRFDEHLKALMDGMNDESAAWALNSYLVGEAQERFRAISEKTGCNDGWVSFELDPIIEDPDANMPHDERVARYLTLGKQWASGYTNRMIKVPATPAGIEALEGLAAEGITLNVTLIFTQRQYEAARASVWKGAQRRKRGLDLFKSVYSIFISRVDVYTDKHVPELSDDAQGMMGLVNAKRLWQTNEEFWKDKNLPLQQEIIFASTGKKLDWQSEDYYAEHLVGSGIQTNPPETNDFLLASDKTYKKTVGEMPSKAVLDELDSKVDVKKLEDTLMAEGIAKFAGPQKKLLAAVKEKRGDLQKR